MSVFAEAASTFQATKAKLEGTRDRLGATRQFLEDLITALRVGARLDTALRRIGDVATALRRTLNAMRTPPAGPWGVAIRALKEALELLLRAIDEATDAAASALRQLDTAMATFRTNLRAVVEVVEALETKVDEAIGVLDNLIAVALFLETQQDKIEKIMGEEWVGELRRLLNLLRTLCDQIDALNQSLDDLQDRLTPLAEEVRRLVDEINGLADQIEQLASELESLRSEVASAWRQILAVINRLPQWLKNLVAQIGEALGNAMDWIQRQLQPYLDEIENLLRDAGVIDAIDAARQRIAQAIDPLTEKAEELKQKVEELQRVVDELQAMLNNARQALEDLLAHLRSLEGFLTLLILGKLIREYYLQEKSEQLWGPINDLESGDFLAALESGAARQHSKAIAAISDELDYAVQRLSPRLKPFVLATSLAREMAAVEREIDPRTEGAVRPTMLGAGRGAFASAMGALSLPDGLREQFEPINRLSIRLSKLSAELSRAVDAWKPGGTNEIEPIQATLAEMKTLLEQVPDLVETPDPAKFPPEYFARGAVLIGLAPRDSDFEGAEGHDWAFTVWNSSGRKAKDVHIVLRGSGGSLQNPRVIFQPDGCPEGRASIPAGQGNQIDIEWDSDCIQPGDTVGVRVESRHVPLAVDSVTWTFAEEEIPG